MNIERDEPGESGSDRGRPATFDRRSGAVSGSGAGAGNNSDSGEDYDSDLHEDAPIRIEGEEGDRRR